MTHYFRCPHLWSFSYDALADFEVSSFVGQRLCFQEPSTLKLRALATCHCIYHSLKNDIQVKQALNSISSACSSSDDSSSSSTSYSYSSGERSGER